jgi:GAF domain-containing protein
MDEERALDAAAVVGAVAAALSGPTEDFVELVVRTALAVFNASGCSIALLSEDRSELVFTTVVGGAGESVSGLRLPAGRGIAGWVASTGQPLAVNELAADPRFASDVASATGYVPRAILACPIATDDTLLGVIEVLDRDERRAGAEDDLQLLGLFARQAALAISAVERDRQLGAVLAAAFETEGAAELGARLRGSGESTELAEVAAGFRALAAAGTRERQLALRLLREIADWSGRAW